MRLQSGVWRCCYLQVLVTYVIQGFSAGMVA